MHDRTMTQMDNWLAAQKQACLARQAALQSDGRQDEAVFQRIRANVFDMALAVWHAAAKQESPAEFFSRRMEQIPASWLAAREKALAHQDTVQAHIEKIKLDAAAEIRAAFRQIWSE